MSDLRHDCTRCGKPIRPRFAVWLELDQRTGTYTAGRVPEAASQGAFPFGKACAAAAEVEHALAQWGRVET